MRHSLKVAASRFDINRTPLMSAVILLPRSSRLPPTTPKPELLLNPSSDGVGKGGSSARLGGSGGGEYKGARDTSSGLFESEAAKMNSANVGEAARPRLGGSCGGALIVGRARGLAACFDSSLTRPRRIDSLAEFGSRDEGDTQNRCARWTLNRHVEQACERC